jgi:hypothetical protein
VDLGGVGDIGASVNLNDISKTAAQVTTSALVHANFSVLGFGVLRGESNANSFTALFAYTKILGQLI